MVSKPSWKEWEEEVAEALGGSLVKASGMTELFKGDVRAGAFLVDCKYTDSKSYTLTADMWRKVSSWAANEGRVPAIAVSVRGEEKFVVVPDWAWSEITGEGYPEDVKVNKSTKSLSSSGETFGVGISRLGTVSFDDFSKGELCD